MTTLHKLVQFVACREHAGEYECKVSNRHGEERVTVSLSVLHR